MKTIHARSRVGPDGILTLTLPVGVSDAELDVTVIMQSVGHNGRPATMTQEEWERFVAQTAGSIEDSTFMIS